MGVPKGPRELHVHLVLREPERHLGDLGRELVEFDPEEVVGGDGRDHAALRPFDPDRFDFQQAQFAVGHHQKVAATASRDRGTSTCRACCGSRTSGCSRRLLRSSLIDSNSALKVVHEQAVHQLQDVAFAGVVGPLGTPRSAGSASRFGRANRTRPEISGSNRSRNRSNKAFSHRAVGIGEVERIGEEFAVDVRAVRPVLRCKLLLAGVRRAGSGF